MRRFAGGLQRLCGVSRTWLRGGASRGPVATQFERTVDEAVGFVLHNVQTCVGRLPGHEAHLQGRTLLEIGPGQDLGIPLVLMGFGARAYVVDPYPCRWTASFHAGFYARLLRAAQERYPGGDFGALEQVVSSRSHDRVAGLVLCDAPLERVPQIPSQSVDLSWSNATLEHVTALDRACAELGRVTATGGIGFHQVDFRDHRDFARPLEHLTLAEADARIALANGEHANYYGSQRRWTSYLGSLQSAGFAVRFDADMLAAADQVAEISARADARYAQMGAEVLRVLSGTFSIEKLQAASPLGRPRGGGMPSST
ncbi:MAG TPA: methyltransferase domain-containing protein [Planctomycetota bacterium]|nr:methyltransferase domain-containing protein [Planctomycetota bacterium]